MNALASRVFVTPGELLEWYAALVNAASKRTAALRGEQRGKA